MGLFGCGGESSTQYKGLAAVGAGGFLATSGGAGQAAAGRPQVDNGGSGGGGATCGPDCSVPVGRAMSVICPATDVSMWQPAAAGSDGQSCSVDADCGTIGPLLGRCLNGQCGADQCLTDGDCPTGQMCGCSSDFHACCTQTNRCIPSGCRVDGDCGENGVCSASIGYCGSLDGYYCHTAADRCHTDADCDAANPICNYIATLGYWTCQSAPLCSG